MKNIKEFICICLLIFLSSLPTYAYRVFPSSGPSRPTMQAMMDNRNYPFVAQYADGIYIQPAGWNRISTTERQTLINQFTNKNVIIEGIFNNQNIATASEVTTLPSSARITAFMLYSDGGAPPMNALAITKIVSQRPPMPIIINCRNFNGNDNNIQVVLNNDSIQGMCYEGVTKDVTKVADIVAGIRYTLDRFKLFVLLMPNSGDPQYNVSLIKYVFSYIKANLPAGYLNSDNLIFAPANYNYDPDFYIAPETEGAGTTMEISKWLIEQKNATLVPQITFTSPLNNDRFDNHKNLTVSLSVTHSVAISNVELFLNNVSIGKDTSAPYSWNSGTLTNLPSGIHNIKAVATDINGKKGDNVIQIRILKDPFPVPGFIFAGDVYSHALTGNSSIKEFYVNNEYRGDVLNYKINVAKAGNYKINFGIYVNPTKNYGGDVLLYNGTTLLGRVSTPYNDPANKNPLIVSNPYPAMILNNIPLAAGLQTLTIKFAHLDQPQVMFSFMDLDFQLENSPTITFTTPTEIKKIFQNYDPTATYLKSKDISIALNATPASGATISKVELYVNDQLVRAINSAPFIWNNAGQDAVLSSLAVGFHTIKAVATDNAGLYSVKSFKIQVIDHTPFTTDNKIPGTIEAEDYDLGGEGIGYHDLNTVLGGIQYRWHEINVARDFVGVSEYTTGKYAVGWTTTGEWLDYTVDVQSTGAYDFSFYTSAAAADKSFSAMIDGTNIGSKLVKNRTINVYDSVTISNVNLTQGIHTIRFNITNGGLNFDKVVVSPTVSTALHDMDAERSFILFPNPTNDIVNIKLKTNNLSALKVYNSIGKVVLENNQISDTYAIRTNDLGGSGLYFFVINGLVQKLMVLN